MSELAIAWGAAAAAIALTAVVIIVAALSERDLDRSHTEVKQLREARQRDAIHLDELTRDVEAAEVDLAATRQLLLDARDRLWQLEQLQAAAEFAPLTEREVFDDLMREAFLADQEDPS